MRKESVTGIAEELFDHSFIGILMLIRLSDTEIHDIGMTLKTAWREIYDGKP